MEPAIVIADEYAMVRQVLEAAGFSIVGEARDGWEAVALVSSLKPDIALVDVVMPGLNGIDTVREISKVAPETRCLIVSSYSGRHYVTEAPCRRQRVCSQG